VDENDISRVIVDSAIEVHRSLGGLGLLESIYEEALTWEIEQRGLRVERQKLIPVAYLGLVINSGERLKKMVSIESSMAYDSTLILRLCVKIIS
jgi:GxxExxY protein